MIKNAFFVVSTRWVDRAISVISMVILARLLAPADFGLVAMASVVVGLMDVILDLGVDAALIQNRRATREDYDTAWTLRLLQMLFSSILIAISAPFAADYYNDARVAPIMLLMSLTLAVSGLQNIGTVAFVKEMQFGKDFQFFVLRRLTSFAVTIGSALYFRSYWALVAGMAASSVATVVLSYWMHPFRPRLSLSRFKALWGFSQWILVNGLASYLATKTDRLVLGRQAGATTIGVYSLGDEVAALPTSAVLLPLGRIMFPAFSANKENRPELMRHYSLAMGVHVMLAVPAGLGLALVAETLVPVLLGSKWEAAVPFVQILSILNIFVGVASCPGYMLLSIGKVRIMALTRWIQLVTLVGLLTALAPVAGAIGIAIARLVATAAGTFLLHGLVQRALSLMNLRGVAAILWRPLVAAIAMSVAVLGVQRMAGAEDILSLMAQVLVGAITYCITIFGLWHAKGRPAGTEQYLIRQTKLDAAFPRLFGTRTA